MNTSHWMDRLTAPVAPRWTLKRQRARIASDLLARHYEGAGIGRRTQGWRRSSGDANAVIGPAMTRLRENARDLVRNNPYAESALSTIADQTVGWGILGKPVTKNDEALDAWKRWAESTDCDADGRCDFYGLQKLVIRTVASDGAVLVRRRLRLPKDGFYIPLQLQLLEPDYIDTTKDLQRLPNGGRIIQGVEFDVIGRRVAYWLFPEHPGSGILGATTSVRVPAESVLHVFKPTRAGQVHAASWFSQVMLRFRDFDEFEDATLMKQKIAACLAVLTSDPDGDGPTVGKEDPENPELDQLGPGAILNLPPGRSVDVLQPPQARDYEPYAKNVLRAIATGIGIPYEDLTGDYTGMPFSAARMSRLRHESRIRDWRWRVLIPQFCDPVWSWVMTAATVMDLVRDAPSAKWTPPPLPYIDPDKEALAAMRTARSGLNSLPELIRERGEDPDELLADIAAFNKKLDELGIVLDSDPRRMTQAGQVQSTSARGASTPAQGDDDEGDPPPAGSTGADDEDEHDDEVDD